jgi:Cft2 family RNA processing exonuclease
LSITVVIEGTRVRGKRIPQKTLRAIWRTLATRRLPRVMALQVTEDAFESALKRMRASDYGRVNARREVAEWGQTLSVRGTDACVFNTHECPGVDYVLLVRDKPYHRLGDVLKHELAHIARGDL